MNNEIGMLLAVGALSGLLLLCLLRRLTAWLRWKRRTREHRAEAERCEMLVAACRVVSDYWYSMAVAGAEKVNGLEQENIELQGKLKQASGDIGLPLPRNSKIVKVMQSAIEDLEKIDDRIGKLDIDEEHREWLRYEIASLAEKIANILKMLSGGGSGSKDSEDDFGAACALKLGSGGTRDVRKKRRRRGRDDDRGR